MEAVEKKCCSSTQPTSKRINAKDGASFLTTLLLILAPKCPFCVMAYMGSIMMFFDIKATTIMPYIVHFKPALGALVLVIIALNYKGRKTWISLAIGGTSLVCILLSSYSLIYILPDWVLYAAFFFAAWYNGNFTHFYRFIKGGLQKVKKLV